VHSPQGNWTRTFGTQTLGGSEPVTANDHLRIGSNTKTWTGTVILQLVQEGRLGLDDPIALHLPDVPNGEQITIRHLLTMRSGLYNYTESLDFNRTLDTEPEKAWSPSELLKIAFAAPPYFAPGEGYHYSNTNTVLLGLLLEKLTGQTGARAFQDRIFTPLGLKGTSFPAIDVRTLPTQYAHGYTWSSNVETVDSLVLPAETQQAARAGTLKPTDVTEVNPSWGSFAGAGISTANDLAVYVEALGNGKLLGPELQRQRLTELQPVDPSQPDGPAYGLAIARFGALYGHSGELPGYNSFMGHDPTTGTTIVTWASGAPAVDGRGPANELARVIEGELYK
jgi:D-alanyl-D-alanine carboxypeptidase